MHTFNNYLEIIQEQRYNFILNESEIKKLSDIKLKELIENGEYDNKINEIVEDPRAAYFFAVHRIENPWGSYNSIINNDNYMGQSAVIAKNTIENSEYKDLYDKFKKSKEPLYQSKSGLTPAGNAFLTFWLTAFLLSTSFAGLMVGTQTLTEKAEQYTKVRAAVDEFMQDSNEDVKIKITQQIRKKIEDKNISSYRNLKEEDIIKAAEEIKEEKVSLFGIFWNKFKNAIFFRKNLI